METARLEHVARMKKDQKEWWKNGIHMKIKLYNKAKSQQLIYRKMLRCNRFD